MIALCRAYNHPPVKGLIETGYINDYEIGSVDVEIALKEATNQQLLDEIVRRSDPKARYLFDTQDEADVVGLRPDLHPVPTPNVDITQYDLVADSSPDEKEGDPSDYEA